MSVDATTIGGSLDIGNIVTIVLFIIGGWIAVRNSTDAKFHECFISLARMEEKVDALTQKVDQQSTVLERLVAVEEQQKTLWKKQDELTERVNAIEHVKEANHAN